MWNRIGEESTPFQLAHDERLYPLDGLLGAADLVGRREAWLHQLGLLESEEDGIRYWAAVGLNAGESMPDAVREALQEQLSDPSPVVRIEAASALASHGETQRSLPVLAEGLTGDVPEVALHAARAIELLGPTAHPLLLTMRQVLAKAQEAKQGGDMMMFLRFSLEASLEKLGAE